MVDASEALHPAWATMPAVVTDGYSLEMTAKDFDALHEAAPGIAPETPVAITFLPGETIEARVAAAAAVRQLGFEPMPHLSARRIATIEELDTMLGRAADEAGARRAFIVAGDPPEPAGPFADTLSIIRTGLLEKHGFRAIGVAGHPEGHPNMAGEALWDALTAKLDALEERGLGALIVTQFGFDADPFIDWLTELRARGIMAPVRIGVPGPAGIKTLLRFAARCGVGASAAVMTKYGVSITQLLGKAGPDKLVDALAARLMPAHGPVRLHFYPFGGLVNTVEWINGYPARTR
ncbi:methylenetetrahydrofolate reductase [uncultured Sphingomonas sp.]|uniref:methylenetetrahydrofolate reductase n=1 Tax=uncultured Sphingomonas sp. TaxID=158754 RepID=UPI0025E2BD92|nr:methylenetetrahydrofolate reductase [uncultured Sphingomonas sp.]